MNKEKLVTVRLSAKDLKEHREEVKNLLIKHSENVMFIGVSAQTFKRFANSVANEVKKTLPYKVVEPKKAGMATKEFLEENCGYDVTEEYVIGEVGKAKPKAKTPVLYEDDETVQKWYDDEYKYAWLCLRDPTLLYCDNKTHKKELEAALKEGGVHYNKVYHRGYTWYVQWRSNKSYWIVSY